MKQIQSELESNDWNAVYTARNVDSAYYNFVSVIKETYDKNCPRRKIRIDNKHDSKPWITKGIIKSCNKKASLYKVFVKNRSAKNERNYKVYRNLLTKRV